MALGRGCDLCHGRCRCHFQGYRKCHGHSLVVAIMVVPPQLSTQPSRSPPLDVVAVSSQERRWHRSDDDDQTSTVTTRKAATMTTMTSTRPRQRPLPRHCSSGKAAAWLPTSDIDDDVEDSDHVPAPQPTPKLTFRMEDGLSSSGGPRRSRDQEQTQIALTAAGTMDMRFDASPTSYDVHVDDADEVDDVILEGAAGRT